MDGPRGGWDEPRGGPDCQSVLENAQAEKEGRVARVLAPSMSGTAAKKKKKGGKKKGGKKHKNGKSKKNKN